MSTDLVSFVKNIAGRLSCGGVARDRSEDCYKYSLYLNMSSSIPHELKCLSEIFSRKLTNCLSHLCLFFASLSFCTLLARRSTGWGLDDDVYFSEPQKVTTFQEEHRLQEAHLKAVKPVKRVVIKPVEHKVEPHECLGPWGLPKSCDMEDWMGLE